MAKSRQFEHLQRQTLKRLQDLIPAECRLVTVKRVEAPAPGGFVVASETGTPLTWGRYQVCANFLMGYVRGWSDRGLPKVW